MGGLLFAADNRLLLLYRPAPRNRWETPGGKVETDEPLTQALVREFYEELGIAITVGSHVGVTSFSEWGRGYTYDWFVVSSFVGDPTIREPEKHSQLVFAAWNDLLTMSISDNLRAFLQHHPVRPERNV